MTNSVSKENSPEAARDKGCADTLFFADDRITGTAVKHRIENPEENRAILLNVHESIIDRVTWEKVQSLQTTRRRRTAVTKGSVAFCGYLKCPEYGGNLTFRFNQGNHDIKFFRCNNHNSGLPAISGWTSWSRSYSRRCIGRPALLTNTKTTLTRRWQASAPTPPPSPSAWLPSSFSRCF